VAVGIAGLVNEQQSKGMDLDGLLGTAVFGVGGVGVLPNAGNAGAAAISVTRSDPAQITRSNYLLEFTGGAWSLRVADTGAPVAMTGTGTAADPFVADGLSFTVGGAAANGDRFMIRPTLDAAAGMDVLFTDAAKFAAALPVTARAASANTGAGVLGDLTVVDPANPNLRAAATITFPTAGTYSVNGGPAQAFTPGTTISANGWSLVLEGTPAAGDTFTIANNTNGVGDNRNFLALNDALASGYLEGGKLTINEGIGRVVSDVGVQTRQAQVSRDALQVVQNDTIAARDAISGVNLDEEAANLVRYQQAYQAAAQVVQVAGTIFDTLLGAIRR
jgi:flagellar hook-associated protein 1 FlgK